ncbi:MAG: T9SS type A sorting domain-containing protein, partial [Bacteroidota bacterium]
LIEDAGQMVSGTFQGLPDGATLMHNGIELTITYFGGMGSDVVLLTASLLPLDLLSFTGEAREKDNLLTWTTANEEDFSHFEVERSLDGNSWAYIGEVAPLYSGEGPGGRSYTFEDEATTAYYRLKMIDLDGTFTYSELVFLENFSGAAAGAMRVYPNPSNGRFTVDLTEVGLSAEEKGELRLLDLHGRTILARSVTAVQPVLGLEWPRPRAGVYLLALLTSNGATLTQRIVIR